MLVCCCSGLDDHFWNPHGYFGRGAYFANASPAGGDPNGLNLSVAFSGQTNPHTLFVCSVLLGNQYDMSDTPIDTPKGSDFFPPPGYNSVKGRILYGFPLTLREHEYVIYRYGQVISPHV